MGAKIGSGKVGGHDREAWEWNYGQEKLDDIIVRDGVELVTGTCHMP